MIACVLLIALATWWSPAADGAIRIKSDVAEVEVFLDGNSVGKTPLTLNAVPAGTHQLSLSKPGYEDQEQQVQVQEGGTARIFVIMKAVPSELPKLPVTFHALHQHAAGSCSGVLTVAADAIEYRSHDGRESFRIPIQDVRSMSRSMGTAWWTGRPLKSTLENSACRLEVPGRSFGFFAYEEDPASAGTPVENRNQVDTKAKTKELYDLIYRLWSDSVGQRKGPKQAAQ